MRLLYFIILFFSLNTIFGQGLEPSQIQGAPRLNDVLQAKNMYVDEYGDTLYIYEHVNINGILISDSIYLRNDSIFLKEGNGFVKIPQQGVRGTGVATRVAWWAGTDSLSSDAALYWDNANKRLGLNTSMPSYGIDINGSLRVVTRTGTAATGAGFTADGQLVAYSLDTSASAPNTYVQSGTNINVTGTGTFADPYIINNLGLITSVIKSGGIIALVEGGNTWNLNINDADSSNTNELQDLYPYSTGFTLSHITSNLQDTVLFDYAASGGGTFVPSSGYIAGAGINITADTIKSTVVNTDAQTLSTNGTRGNISISGGNTITINVSDLDSSATNEIQTISKTGNVATLTPSGGTFNISQTVIPADGNVLTWNSGQWNAAAPSGGGGSGAIEESFNASNVNLSTSNATLATLSLAAGTWKLDASSTVLENQSIGKDLTVEFFNSTANSLLNATREGMSNGSIYNIGLTKKVILGSTSTIILRARVSNGTALGLVNQCYFTAIKI